MIYLNKEAIGKVISYGELIDAIGEAYKIYGDRKFVMPDRMHVDHGSKNLLYMPCFKDGIFGTKIITVFPENAGKHPVIDGLMLLNDLETGEPKGMMDGKTITALRTGAVGGFGVKHTARPDVKSLGVIGAGVQGFYQAAFACEVRDFREVYIYDLNRDHAQSTVDRLKEAFKDRPIDVKVADTSEDLVAASEVIITATTATRPVIPSEWAAIKGKHFVGIGSYKEVMREFPDELFRNLSLVVIDTEFAKEESGDLIQPLRDGVLEESKIIEFSDFLGNDIMKKNYIEETTLFKSVGMALFDVVVSELIYNKAIELNEGQNIVL